MGDAAVDALSALGARITRLGPVIDPLRPSFEAYWLAGFAERLRAIPPARRDEMDPQLRRLAEQGVAVGIESLLAGEAARAVLEACLGIEQVLGIVPPTARLRGLALEVRGKA